MRWLACIGRSNADVGWRIDGIMQQFESMNVERCRVKVRAHLLFMPLPSSKTFGCTGNLSATLCQSQDFKSRWVLADCARSTFQPSLAAAVTEWVYSCSSAHIMEIFLDPLLSENHTLR